MTGSLKNETRLQVQEDEVRVLHNPSEYFEVLKSFLRTSKREVVFSALYFGTGSQEKELISELEDALGDESRPQLRVSLLLDHSRSQRGPESSLSLLGPVAEKFPDRCRVYLYQMPFLRPWYMSLLPFQLREVLGVYHCKFCIADQRVLLTGANLSAEYFSNRQDRCWLIHNKETGDNIAEFLTSFSRLVMADSALLHSHIKIVPPKESSQSVCESSLKALQNTYDFNMNTVQLSSTSMLCLPVLQHASLSIRAEESSLWRLLQTLSQSFSDVTVKFATPYTNFPPKLLEGMMSIISNGGTVDIMGPGSCSHGFAKATGLKSLIPQLHEAALQSSISEALAHTSYNNFDPVGTKYQLSYWGYERAQWTYHAKGLWFNAKQSCGSNLSGTYIGSSNFGIRSWVRDFELGFIFLGTAASHRQLQHTDFDHLRSFCIGADKKISIGEARHATSSFVRFISKIIKGYL